MPKNNNGGNGTDCSLMNTTSPIPQIDICDLWEDSKNDAFYYNRKIVRQVAPTIDITTGRKIDPLSV